MRLFPIDGAWSCFYALLAQLVCTLDATDDGSRAREPTEEAALDVVSIGSHVTKELLARSNLLSEFPATLKLLGAEHQDTGQWKNLYKLLSLHSYLREVPSDRIVMVLDLYDVVWMDCKRGLQTVVQTFLGFGRPIVFGAELVPYPLSNASLYRLPGGYPMLPDVNRSLVTRKVGVGRAARRTSYRYLNSGCIVGYASALLQATGRMIKNDFLNEYVLDTHLATLPEERSSMLVGSDDQVAWHAYAVRHPEEIALDYFAELFLNVHGFHYADFRITSAGEIWAEPFQRTLCFAHGNGASNLAIYLRTMQRKGLQPQSCEHREVQAEHGVVHAVACEGKTPGSKVWI